MELLMQSKSELAEFQYELEPWDDDVNGKALYNQIYLAVETFVVLEPAQIHAITIWILHTYFIRPNDSAQLCRYSPLLFLTSPERACGKSTLLKILSALSHYGKIATNISDASLFRLVAGKKITLFLDEIDTYFSKRSEMVGLLNSGFEVTGSVLRQTGGDFGTTTEFSTWGAKCIAGIGSQPDTLESRTLKIQLKRKTAESNLRRAPEVLAQDPNYFINIKRCCIKFAIENETEILTANEIFFPEIDDRAHDCWSGLLRLASYIGELDNTKESARYLSVNAKPDESESIEFLRDVRSFLKTLIYEKFPTAQIIAYLNRLEDRPYKYIRKDGINAYDLSVKLKPYGIRSKQIKFSGNNIKGYEVAVFQEVFKRYLPEDLSNQEGNN
jgi:hypothetical protein